ncbi:Sec-independent protein translocase protein TatB [Marinicella rhabdoformis]|uniref:Sec-independent protein translocase protein TatB n=1 Tax=Marinicella rhabdoformis TaxID=2580566 RepID=UPI0012AEC992|nr:Sec-independent protein translocase protein TatB [Marinicella rhabdoformis]
MFDVGFSELLVVFVVMLLVVGPERLPIVARKIGLYLGKMRRSFLQVKAEVEQELEIEAVKAQLKDNAMKKEAELLKQELDKDVSDAFEPSQAASDEFEDENAESLDNKS